MVSKTLFLFLMIIFLAMLSLMVLNRERITPLYYQQYMLQHGQSPSSSSAQQDILAHEDSFVFHEDRDHNNHQKKQVEENINKDILQKQLFNIESQLRAKSDENLILGLKNITHEVEDRELKNSSSQETRNHSSGHPSSFISNSSSLNFDHPLNNQTQKLRSKILALETKHLLLSPLVKPSDSRMIYPSEIIPMTIMNIDHECGANYGQNLTVVIVVISSVNGFERRRTIRNTWGGKVTYEAGKDGENGETQNEKRDNLSSGKNIPPKVPSSVRIFFATGLTLDSSIQKRLEEENSRYQDIIQFGFIDNYYNLTLKSLGILRWSALSCFNARYLYKVDDDCIINVENLIHFCENKSLSGESISGDENVNKINTTIHGYLWKSAYVDRERKHKFYLSRHDFPHKYYPDYTGGPWLMRSSLASKLYVTAITESLPALPFEDVYITGVVASKIKGQVTRKQLPGLVYFSDTPQNIDTLNACWFNNSIIFWQHLDDTLINQGWKQIIDTWSVLSSCDKRWSGQS